MYFVMTPIVILLWCFYVRRQLVPDLFVALYCVALALLDISSRTLHGADSASGFLDCLARVPADGNSRGTGGAGPHRRRASPLGGCHPPASRTTPTEHFPIEGMPPDNWNQMRTLFGFIRANTAPDSILLANLDGAFFLNTGRKTVRGFVPNEFDLYYRARQSTVTPDQLSKAIVRIAGRLGPADTRSRSSRIRFVPQERGSAGARRGCRASHHSRRVTGLPTLQSHTAPMTPDDYC